MRILVLGAGAVGGYFGGRLVQAGADVTFLVRPARAATLASRGLEIQSPLGDVHILVKTATAGSLKAEFDAVLLAAKAYDLDQALADIRPAMGPATAVLPLLNGLGHLDRLDAAFGRARVLGGVAYIAATLSPDGAIRHLNRINGITFGERSGGPGDRIAAIAEAFAGTPVNASISGRIMQEMWEKFIMIAALAGMNCLMRAAVGEIMATEDGNGLMLDMLEECEAVAAASGYPPRDESRAQYRGLLTEHGSNFAASMLRDLEAGRRTEGDQILGDMLRRANAVGVSATLLRLAVCHLQVHEQRLAIRRAHGAMPSV
jgi:2-dehydropantoate 2-reductase